jgi:hypothetical protein
VHTVLASAGSPGKNPEAGSRQPLSADENLSLISSRPFVRRAYYPGSPLLQIRSEFRQVPHCEVSAMFVPKSGEGSFCCPGAHSFVLQQNEFSGGSVAAWHAQQVWRTPAFFLGLPNAKMFPSIGTISTSSCSHKKTSQASGRQTQSRRATLVGTKAES